jgi:hypothetical protein
MDWFERKELTGPALALFERLRKERIVWDTSSAGELAALRGDAARIAADMDDPRKPPPMFWTGIPWPPPGPEPTGDYHLVVSVGGTKTDFALLRLEKGATIALDPTSGREVSSPREIERVKAATQMLTPKHGPATPTGQEMVSQMVAHLASHLGPYRAALDRSEAILLSWGFAHRVIRTGPRLAGGLSARVTKMTKDQAGFTPDLAGKDIGALFSKELENQLGWTRPIAVANDTVMALHYFLGPKRRSGHGRVGLFINGTGTNFSAAEPYAVRPEGTISSGNEDYAPERLTRARPLRPGEKEILFFVNYESGSIDLAATRTRFDTDPEYPIERNALAGGNAFGQSLRALVSELVSRPVYQKLLERWRGSAHGSEQLPGAPAVSALATGSKEAGLLLEGFPGEEDLAGRLRLVARAVVARSALHAALVLSAVTLRTGFGAGQGGLPDLLGMEGSVWKIPGYPTLVKGYWEELAAPRALSVDLAAEPSYNASLSGPLYLAALHR